MKERFFLGPDRYEEQEGWWSVLADGGFLSPDEVADLEYIAENPMIHKSEIDFLARTHDIFEAHPTIIQSIQNGLMLLKEQLLPYQESLNEFMEYVNYLNGMGFFEKQAGSEYYRLK